MTKPRLFIGSSVESIDIANAIHASLERDAEVTVWNQGVFEPSQYALESLTEILDQADFGAFVFAPNDVLRIRDQTTSAVRDNVIFELGLCVGALGRKRSFIFRPRGVRDLHFPTDLLGLTPVEYEDDRRDRNWRAAVGPAGASVAAAMRKLGPRGLPEVHSSQTPGDRKSRAAALLRACEAAAGAAARVEDRSHPEWRDLSVSLEIGEHHGPNEHILYVKASYQSRPHVTGEKTHATTWYKWYVGIPQPSEPEDTYVLFEELPRLLRRPGDLSFEAEGSIPAWVREQVKAPQITGLLYHTSKIY